MNKRRFNRSERSSLYLQSNGYCAMCGKALPAGWHADHVTPYARGGQTILENGQALCPDCNRKKGMSTMRDSIQLRPAQLRMFEAVQRKLGHYRKTRSTENKTVVAWLDPGTGKTLGWLHCANWLFRQGVINSVAAFTPRVNLCTQAELDWWNDFRPLYSGVVMQKIVHRDNNPPLLRNPDEFGYVSTYQSLIANPRIHEQFVRKNRTLLVLDEAQVLGLEDNEQGGQGTESARMVRDLAEHAAMIFLLTGTPYRADNSPLILAKYTAPDQHGITYLDWDARASYLEGVKDGYLRPFDAHLMDGRGQETFIDNGSVETHILSEMRRQFRKIIGEPDYWQPFVDRVVSDVRDLQTVDRRHCGLIACADQRQASDIERYLKSAHPSIRSLIAISDRSESYDNLRRFKEGRHDILITVAMAHVGYDYKPITVVGCLSVVREEGWLRQLFARGMRVMSDGANSQYVKVIAPNDPRMREVTNKLRRESDEGLKLRDERAIPAPPPAPIDIRPSVMDYVETTGISALGLDPRNDVNPVQYEHLSVLMKKHGLTSAPMTGVMGILRDVGYKVEEHPDAITPITQNGRPARRFTTAEREKELRRAIQNACNACNRALIEFYKIEEPGAKQLSYAQTEILRYFGVESTTKMGMEQLLEVKKWLNNVFLPDFEKKIGRGLPKVVFNE